MKTIQDVINYANGNKSEAARILGISRQAVQQARPTALVPPVAVLKTARKTGWSVSDIRGDLYPPETTWQTAEKYSMVLATQLDEAEASLTKEREITKIAVEALDAIYAKLSGDYCGCGDVADEALSKIKELRS